MTSISFRTKIILLAVLPVLISGASITALAIYKMRNLASNNSEYFVDKVRELRREELKNYTELALTAVDHVYENAEANDEAAQNMAKTVFRNLRYGKDGYFFVYDFEGMNVVHPIKAYLEGQNLWDLQDANGSYLIRSLIRNAKSDTGGYTYYLWDKPSLNRQVDKISFSAGMNKWRWMIGTGIYMDDVDALSDDIEASVEQQMYYTIVLTAGAALLGTFVVAFLAMRLTVSQGRLASQKLQHLSRSCVQEREIEREVIAHDLKHDVLQPVQPLMSALMRISDECELKDADKKSLLKVVSELGNIDKSVRYIANQLHPDILVKEGLYPAIEELAANLTAESGIKISAKTVSRTEERPQSNIETACYRIVCEALMNVIRHSQAAEASIRFRQTRSSLSLTIQDNGVGFDMTSKHIKSYERGVGLADMQLQVELLNGSFTVFSSQGTGTMIKIFIPLQGSSSEHISDRVKKQLNITP